MISRSNYEIFFIDYFDKQLDKSGQEELFAFLKMNPDLQDEFNHYSLVQSDPDLSINFGSKDKLKKNTITIYNYKTWLVGYIENDLIVEQKNEVELFLSKNDILKTELEILKLSQFVSDKQIIFRNKNKLMRGPKIITFTPAVKRTFTIAAALIIFALTYFIIHSLNVPKSIVVDTFEKIKNRPVENKISEVVKSQSDNMKSYAAPHIGSIMKKNKAQSNIAVKSENNTEHFQLTNQKEVQYVSIPDTLHQFQLEENLSTLIANDNNIALNNPLSIGLNVPSIIFKEINSYTADISEIFSEQELIELGISQNTNLNKTKSINKTLFELATSGLKKISNSMDITIDKQKGPLGNSATYAFGVGNNFSISHTTVQ